MRVILATLGDTAHHTTLRSNITPSITIARTSGSAMLTNIKIYKLAFQKIAAKGFSSARMTWRWRDQENHDIEFAN
jgi:hypothetical protein